ncbi:polysaccharide pyruvyl transferase family protein [Pseudoalteromonas sp. bablab_jr011]|uniref:polysaccharide pyruvyl transferase family protein n=1 Tax=Pseudoalteromonas sp. bablab_jr011 TaxID=2755062 RepID=UPI0018F38C0E|nr:polysaccharide pyruvyl transferase family protein [Pseudoalteromonas sp. bablab_jr011]
MKGKRVGILTLPLINNYGGILQAYALKEVLRKNGYETLLIDYRKNKISKKNSLNMAIRNFIKKTILKYKKLEPAVTPTIQSEISRNAKDFVSRELGKKTKPIYDFSELKKLNYEVDIFVVGSDQVWRPEYTPNIRRYFFDFVDEGKKVISYAASFGTDTWGFTNEEFKDCKVNLSKFNALSVREKSAIDIMHDKFGVTSELVLDPTMLLSKSDYLDLINKYNEQKNKGNLFCYILDKNEFSISVIKKISTKLGLEPFEVKPKAIDYNYKKGSEEYIYPFMTKWIRAFYDSEYVIVDSFHGCVFSIIFNKPFIAIGNVKRGLARFKSLLSLFDLEDRLILNSEKFNESLIEHSYNWDAVNKKVFYLQKKSSKFIFDNIKDE